MVCRRAVLVLVLGLATHSARSSEPLGQDNQQSNTGSQQRVKVRVTGNSLKYVIRDPAMRVLLGTDPPVRRTNHELFEGASQHNRILVSQLDPDRPRDAIDALREVTDDLDLDLPKALPGPPNRPEKRPPQVITAPVEPPVESISDEATDRFAPRLDALQDEQRKRELQLLLESLNREKQAQANSPGLDRNMDSAADATGVDDSLFDYDDGIMKPEPIYNSQSNYDQIPWTISGLTDEPDFNQQCLEQEFCQRVWQCAGGRYMRPSDRWKRDLRRTYEMTYGPCSHPLFAGLIVEPLLGYGFFGSMRAGCAKGCRMSCTSRQTSCSSCGGAGYVGP